MSSRMAVDLVDTEDDGEDEDEDVVVVDADDGPVYPPAAGSAYNKPYVKHLQEFRASFTSLYIAAGSGDDMWSFPSMLPYGGLEIEPVGVLSLPLCAAQAQQLREQALAGSKSKSECECEGERSIGAHKLRVDDSWNVGVQRIVDKLVLGTLGFGSTDKLQAKLRCLMLYDTGAATNRRTPEEEVDMEANPNFVGGQLIISHDSRKSRFESAPASGTRFQYAAFFRDCSYEMQRVTDGQVMFLSYDIMNISSEYDPDKPLPHMEARTLRDEVKNSIIEWSQDPERPLVIMKRLYSRLEAGVKIKNDEFTLQILREGADAVLETMKADMCTLLFQLCGFPDAIGATVNQYLVFQALETASAEVILEEEGTIEDTGYGYLEMVEVWTEVASREWQVNWADEQENTIFKIDSGVGVAAVKNHPDFRRWGHAHGDTPDNMDIDAYDDGVGYGQYVSAALVMYLPQDLRKLALTGTARECITLGLRWFKDGYVKQDWLPLIEKGLALSIPQNTGGSGPHQSLPHYTVTAVLEVGCEYLLTALPSRQIEEEWYHWLDVLESQRHNSLKGETFWRAGWRLATFLLCSYTARQRYKCANISPGICRYLLDGLGSDPADATHTPQTLAASFILTLLRNSPWTLLAQFLASLLSSATVLRFFLDSDDLVDEAMEQLQEAYGDDQPAQRDHNAIFYANRLAIELARYRLQHPTDSVTLDDSDTAYLSPEAFSVLRKIAQLVLSICDTAIQDPVLDICISHQLAGEIVKSPLLECVVDYPALAHSLLTLAMPNLISIYNTEMGDNKQDAEQEEQDAMFPRLLKAAISHGDVFHLCACLGEIHTVPNQSPGWVMAMRMLLEGTRKIDLPFYTSRYSPLLGRLATHSPAMVRLAMEAFDRCDGWPAIATLVVRPASQFFIVALQRTPHLVPKLVEHSQTEPLTRCIWVAQATLAALAESSAMSDTMQDEAQRVMISHVVQGITNTLDTLDLAGVKKGKGKGKGKGKDTGAGTVRDPYNMTTFHSTALSSSGVNEVLSLLCGSGPEQHYEPPAGLAKNTIFKFLCGVSQISPVSCSTALFQSLSPEVLVKLAEYQLLDTLVQRVRPSFNAAGAEPCCHVAAKLASAAEVKSMRDLPKNSPAVIQWKGAVATLLSHDRVFRTHSPSDSVARVTKRLIGNMVWFDMQTQLALVARGLMSEYQHNAATICAVVESLLSYHSRMQKLLVSSSASAASVAAGAETEAEAKAEAEAAIPPAEPAAMASVDAEPREIVDGETTRVYSAMRMHLLPKLAAWWLERLKGTRQGKPDADSVFFDPTATIPSNIYHGAAIQRFLRTRKDRELSLGPFSGVKEGRKVAKAVADAIGPPHKRHVWYSFHQYHRDARRSVAQHKGGRLLVAVEVCGTGKACRVVLTKLALEMQKAIQSWEQLLARLQRHERMCRLIVEETKRRSAVASASASACRAGAGVGAGKRSREEDLEAEVAEDEPPLRSRRTMPSGFKAGKTTASSGNNSGRRRKKS